MDQTGRASIGEIFAVDLRDLRRTQGISQIELARLAGLSHRYIGRLERCEKSPTLNTLQALAEALDVDSPILISPAAEREKLSPPIGRNEGR